MRAVQNNNIDLVKIWNQVPVDYYQKETKKNIIKKLWHNEKINILRELIGHFEPDKILDVGCASGYMANEISKIFPNASMYGIDVYDKAINYGKKKYPKIKFEVADAHNLPFPKDTFDLVVSYETIEHVVDPLKILKEMKSVLKNEGLAIVAMDSGNWLFRIIWWISEKTFTRVWQNAHLHPFKQTELEATIKKSGFKIIKKHFSHFGMEVSFLLKKW